MLVGLVLFAALARVQPESNVLAIAGNKQAVVESAVLFLNPRAAKQLLLTL